MKNEPQLSAEMERKAEEVFEHYNGDGYANPCPRIPCDCQVKEYKHFLATALEEQEKEYFEKINIKNKTIEHMMEEIRYLRSSQPARRKPIIRIKNGDRWYIPMITQAHDTPDGLYIEAELAILNGKEA